MAGPFVVVGKPLRVRADLEQPALETDPAQRIRIIRRGVRQVVAVGGPQGVVGKIALDVGDQELLMLLLVMQPDAQTLGDGRPIDRGTVLDQPEHRLVDMMPIVVDLRDRRPGQETSLGPRPEAGSGLLVVAIEEVLETRVEDPVAGQEGTQQEGLVEPGDMRQMPLRRARLDPCLKHIVFDRERLAQLLGQGADTPEDARQIRSHGIVLVDPCGMKGHVSLALGC